MYVLAHWDRDKIAAISQTTFSDIFFNGTLGILVKDSQRFVPKGRINNIPALVRTMAWRRQGDKPLSEPMVVSLLAYFCVTQPQWINANYRNIARTFILIFLPLIYIYFRWTKYCVVPYREDVVVTVY